MQLENILAALEQPPIHIYKADQLNTHADITAIAYDSRKLTSGGLFIAVPGTHTDGRLYLKDAARKGAVAALGAPLTEEQKQDLPLPYIEVADVLTALANVSCAFYDYPASKLCTIGVTGTDGKTTVSNLISAILDTAGLRSGLMTTANFKISGQEWDNATRQSTLEAPEIQQFLKRMLEAQVTHAVIESTSHGLELKRVHGCQFDVGVVTNITHEHLDFHKTIENYRRAKARLFEMLDPERDKGLGCRSVAVLNRDDVSYEILKPYCRVPILDYGIDTPAAIRAVDLDLRANGTSFRVLLPDGEIMIETPLIGRFNVSNCLAAIAVAYSQGIAPEVIARTLKTVKGVSGRMEHIDEGQPFTVIVDYAHTPDSLGKVLSILRPLTSGKLMVVFGSAGERDLQKRPLMGKIAAQMTDFFVITDEDPREEDREKILEEIAVGAESTGKKRGTDFLCIADRTEAIATAFAHAEPGDTVLLAGKGHEQSIIIGREKLPWDDRRVAREQLQQFNDKKASCTPIS
ncbi:UDP-N-acetylmuramoylalanyl-D-glutamate--2,6-diaminopimelate ligase [Thermosporothrix hazakensis]|jgi:UDP-N-acetylmuramoyl-L-alanyl-D-glutamate--2,6-diaminopimelate ligase|uniref:UDP-N-acetylmuramyl-tripeptide synthetase n=1 Tax=Thermosporothrix hazakensis TaxID=644383 RepID=A0A326UD56_THEHA|nr:UDP-N-acetylmuramoyl-L-alanyl-D-glutamate--2,6-diaminopimelate ligase [Thermosporothrix hazakensis]PZW35875.1 UDP-N-acetylmuramoylalanyl-D-glutamate--2,6-diaminopimelate ligase [Thermosporothrix hazakensis]GCE46527.1 UDP-N-acetylmuramyl-tripeptide synthetase [Thermosporothrix hazakensis]